MGEPEVARYCVAMNGVSDTRSRYLRRGRASAFAPMVLFFLWTPIGIFCFGPDAFRGNLRYLTSGLLVSGQMTLLVIGLFLWRRVGALKRVLLILPGAWLILKNSYTRVRYYEGIDSLMFSWPLPQIIVGLVVGLTIYVAIFLSIKVADKASSRGRDWKRYFWLSLLLNPIPFWVYLAFTEAKQTCRMCAERVKSEAKICRHCGTALV